MRRRRSRQRTFPYRVPSVTDIRERLAGVLAVIYLIFNEGYLATAGDDPVRADLTDEAIRLCRLLRTLLPDEGEVTGLLALMLLTDARRTARVSHAGELVTLDEQDRGAWNRALVIEGHALVRARIAAVAAGAEPPGQYQLLAAINAVHTDAPSARDTDWSQIVALYDRLSRLDPSPIVRLNRAIAVAETRRPRRGARRDRPTQRVPRRVPRLPRRARRPPSAGSGGATNRGRRTTEPSNSPATPPSGPTSPAAATNSCGDPTKKLPRPRSSRLPRSFGISLSG